ncbi:MAG: LemA family protein [Casimicrobiaceae bacterium]|nr:LemA family protein [Casimicrobiaceae bacterium]MCX8099535.1 LemA family protein [Casimicrobiaceae bacterium]MDW8311402.1 LemA family protein [Burkholderiales bacterium]
MTRRLRNAWLVLISAAAVLSLSGCGYNDMAQGEENIKAAWAEVTNQYQRRADLIPNLVNTVKGFAEQEKEVLTRVVEARAKATQITVTPEMLDDPQAMQRFAAAQRELGSALSRLLAVAENYPQLKSDAVFRDLTAQLEGTENRIAVARNRYIKAIQAYNNTVVSFPTNITAMIFGFKKKEQFQVEDEAAIKKAPTVDFSKPAAPAKP